jgi:hypothetical protein
VLKHSGDPVDANQVKARLRDLPSAVLTLANSLSRDTRHEALEVAQLFRGLAIQVALRWCLGELLVVPSRSALVYSQLDAPAGLTRAGRTVAGVGLGTVVGLALFGLSNLLLLMPLVTLLLAVGFSHAQVLPAFVVIPSVRLGWTAWRAAVAYRVERARAGAMVRVGSSPRWRLDLMGSAHPRQGDGLRLVRAFTQRSDAAGATVYLVCQPNNREFYRRAGFRVVETSGRAYDGMLLMRRIAPARRPVPAQRVAPAAERALASV